MLTTARNRNLTSFPEALLVAEPGRKQVQSVADWAGIWRLRRVEQMPIVQIARVLGSRSMVKRALASESPPKPKVARCLN